MNDGGTQKANRTQRLEMLGQATSLSVSQMLALIRTSCDGDRNKVGKSVMSRCREKLLVSVYLPVPQTDTGSRGEHPKVSE